MCWSKEHLKHKPVRLAANYNPLLTRESFCLAGTMFAETLLLLAPRFSFYSSPRLSQRSLCLQKKTEETTHQTLESAHKCLSSAFSPQNLTLFPPKTRGSQSAECGQIKHTEDWRRPLSALGFHCTTTFHLYSQQDEQTSSYVTIFWMVNAEHCNMGSVWSFQVWKKKAVFDLTNREFIHCLFQYVKTTQKMYDTNMSNMLSEVQCYIYGIINIT